MSDVGAFALCSHCVLRSKIRTKQPVKLIVDIANRPMPHPNAGGRLRVATVAFDGRFMGSAL